jgi:hypothetical protein
MLGSLLLFAPLAHLAGAGAHRIDAQSAMISDSLAIDSVHGPKTSPALPG